MLDRRLELTGMRRDGTEFPVELTITRIALPGPPTFTGYLRDITVRTRAIRELRASRARLVEVADAERIRIQRNLHDGAQQRLTSALLTLGRIRAASDEHAALLELAIDELATGLQEIRELAGGLHPSVLTERGLVAALEALALRRRCRSSCRTCPTGGSPSRSRRPPTTSSPRRSPTCTSTPARAASSCASRSTHDRLAVAVAR